MSSRNTVRPKNTTSTTSTDNMSRRLSEGCDTRSPVSMRAEQDSFVGFFGAARRAFAPRDRFDPLSEDADVQPGTLAPRILGAIYDFPEGNDQHDWKVLDFRTRDTDAVFQARVSFHAGERHRA